MLRYCIVLICFSCVCYVADTLREGSACVRDGLQGLCVPVHRCLTAVIDISNGEYPPICSFDGSIPIICCTDCELVKDIDLILFDRKLGMLARNGTSKARDKCVEYIYKLDYPCKDKYPDINSFKTTDEERGCTVFGQEYAEPVHRPGVGIAGGTITERGEFPHMALLGYGENRENVSWFCAGTVISERFILTAAHCLFSRDLGDLKFIALGILKRSDPAEDWQHYSVKTAFPHPEYKSPSKYNDIALLETDREIVFNNHVRPACLHTDDDWDAMAVATGWGEVGSQRGYSDVLQKVGLKKFSDETCAKLFTVHRHLLQGYHNKTQMCYGDNKESETPTDSCRGDSGGPLQSDEHQPCVFTILGVTSHGQRCGQRGGAGIYTRVASYVPWIESIVWP